MLLSTHYNTSNVKHHGGLKLKLTFVCRYMALPSECYYNTLLCCDYFSSSSVVSRSFSALCMHSKFGHHLHPLGYLCAKVYFFRDLASPWRKIAYSLTHSPSLSDASEPKHLHFRTMTSFAFKHDIKPKLTDVVN